MIYAKPFSDIVRNGQVVGRRSIDNWVVVLSFDYDYGSGCNIATCRKDSGYGHQIRYYSKDLVILDLSIE